MIMRVGIMIRTIDGDDGPGTYTRNLLKHLLEMDTSNEYVLFYKTKKHFGRYAEFKNVREILIKVPSIFLWDQVAVPFYARKEGEDFFHHVLQRFS